METKKTIRLNMDMEWKPPNIYRASGFTDEERARIIQNSYKEQLEQLIKLVVQRLTTIQSKSIEFYLNEDIQPLADTLHSKNEERKHVFTLHCYHDVRRFDVCFRTQIEFDVPLMWQEVFSAANIKPAEDYSSEKKE